MKDDSLSPVFNLRGCSFDDVSITNPDGTFNVKSTNISRSNIPYKTFDSASNKWVVNYLERDEFLSSESDLSNTFGVFKNPVQNDKTLIQNYQDKTTKP